LLLRHNAHCDILKERKANRKRRRRKERKAEEGGKKHVALQEMDILELARKGRKEKKGGGGERERERGI